MFLCFQKSRHSFLFGKISVVPRPVAEKGGTAGLAEVVAELEWDLNTTADCKRRRGVVGRGFERPAVAATQPVVPVGWH